MLLKIALAFCLTRTLLAADEHKSEPKKIETHSPEPQKKEEVKTGDKKETATHETAKPSPVKAAEPKPSALEVRRPTPKITPRRNIATRNPSRNTRSEPIAAAVAKPAPPIVVEVKQEPARVEAILRIVPYGIPGAPGSIYPNQAFSVSSFSTPRAQWSGESLATQNPAPTEARETMVGIFAPANFTPAPAAPSYDSPQPRNPPPPNTLKKAPKNALTNEGLVILAEAGYDEEFILDLMKMKNCRFDTSAEGLAYMATHGLTERLVKAALQADIESERKSPELEAHR